MLLEATIEKDFSEFRCRFEFVLERDRCGVFGPSGSGKSSLMYMLAGLMRPDRGIIRLNGVTLFDREKGINLPPERRRVGVVFQHAHLFPHMNVAQNLFYGMKRTPAAKRTIAQDTLIATLHLERFLHRGIAQLSGGERQRVALGRALLACPDLILLDEPLTGLDTRLKYQIIPELLQVFEEFEIPMLFISHDLQEMRMLTEETLVLHNGAVDARMATEMLARAGLVTGGTGYLNLLDLDRPEEAGDLVKFDWGGTALMLVRSATNQPGRFTLSSRDILLFKKHPEAGSARNILPCTVRSTYPTEWLIGVEMECGGNTLIAEVVPQSVAELDIRAGTDVIAVFKASAFRRLY